MLQIGDIAPNFSLPNQSLENIELSAFKGKKVVLYFYPKDMTPGCTKQACDFRDYYANLQDMNVEVIGISKDSEKRHNSFITNFNLPFTLLSDLDNTVCALYGAWVEKSFLGKKYMGINRTTYLIDEQGKIVHIWPKVNVIGHAAEIVSLVEKMA